MDLTASDLTAAFQALVVGWGWAAGLKVLFFFPGTFQSSCTTIKRCKGCRPACTAALQHSDHISSAASAEAAQW